MIRLKRFLSKPNIIRISTCSYSSKPKPLPQNVMSYEDAFKASIEKPQEFWATVANEVKWHKKWNTVLDNSAQPFTKWWSGGELSVCYNAIDRHVEDGFGDQTAISFDSPAFEIKEKRSFKQIQQRVAALARSMTNNGVKKGDRVLIYMGMVPEAIESMMACNRIGAVHVLVFGGFTSNTLAVRIRHCKPKLVLVANGAMERGKFLDYKQIVDKGIELSGFQPKYSYVYNREVLVSSICGADMPNSTSSSLDPTCYPDAIWTSTRKSPKTSTRLTTAFLSKPTNRSTFSTPPVPPANPKESCAQPETQFPLPGQCPTYSA